LSEETGEVVGIFPTLYGRFVFHLVTAQLPVAVDLADEFLGLASGQDHPEPIMLGHRVVGLSNLFSGELSKAVKHLQAAVNFDIQESHRSAPYLYGQDIETASRCLYSLALSHTGRPDEALRMANASFGRAQKLNHPHSLAYALAFSSFGFSDWQRVDELNWCLRRLKAVISENPDMHLWPLMEDYLQFRCLALSARPEKALPHVDSFLTGMTAARFTVMLPGVIAEKADALVELGDGDAAMQSIDDALEMARSSGEFWQISKILGVKARVHLLLGDDLEANNTFQLSLHDARQYRYVHSELRVTTQYASFLRHSGKREHAKELLDRVLGKCTEGANLPDMVAAYTLRDALAV
jgi:tetratricopeptide (TPR) repeat protein